jgi:Flp pilus assembly protein TadD
MGEAAERLDLEGGDLMTRRFVPCVILLSAAVGAALALAPRAAAQTRVTGGVRGKVVDEQSAGVPDVKIDMEYLGESRQKITKTQQTDKKGGFVRMGLAEGRWKFTFSKEGFKTYVMEMDISLGGFSESPDVVLHSGASTGTPAAAAGQPVAAVLPPRPESNKAGETYNKAVEAAQAGRYDEAEPMLKEILAQFPDLAPAHYNLGYVYQKKKDWKAAEAEYQRVTELEPAKSDAFLALAAVRELDGRTQEAAEGLLAAAPGFAQDARFQYVLGLTCMNAGKNAEAEAALKKAAELDPANPEPYFQLATIAVGSNHVPEAVGLLEKYLAMSGQVPANVETAKGLLGALKKK